MLLTCVRITRWLPRDVPVQSPRRNVQSFHQPLLHQQTIHHKRLGGATRLRQKAEPGSGLTDSGLADQLQPLIESRATQISWTKMGTASSASLRKYATDGHLPSGSHFRVLTIEDPDLLYQDCQILSAAAACRLKST